MKQRVIFRITIQWWNIRVVPHAVLPMKKANLAKKAWAHCMELMFKHHMVLTWALFSTHLAMYMNVVLLWIIDNYCSVLVQWSIYILGCASILCLIRLPYSPHPNIEFHSFGRVCRSLLTRSPNTIFPSVSSACLRNQPNSRTRLLHKVQFSQHSCLEKIVDSSQGLTFNIETNATFLFYPYHTL